MRFETEMVEHIGNYYSKWRIFKNFTNFYQIN